MATCLQRAEQRWGSEQDSNSYLNHAIDAAYAARALKAVLDSNLTMLEQCFRKVGRVPPSIAVACLMARHRRLGAHSPMKVVPNFVIRYILSILGAPFDLLNDKLYCVQHHITDDWDTDKQTRQGESKAQHQHSATAAAAWSGTYQKQCSANKFEYTLHYCGVTFQKTTNGVGHVSGSWIPMTVGPPKLNDVVYDDDDNGQEWRRNMLSQIVLEDQVLMSTGLGEAFPDKVVSDSLPDLQKLEQAFRSNSFYVNGECLVDYEKDVVVHPNGSVLLNGGRRLAHQRQRERRRAINLVKQNIHDEFALKATAADLIVHGDTLLHVASRMVKETPPKASTKTVHQTKAFYTKNNQRQDIVDYLASLSPLIQMNSKHELPKHWKATLTKQHKREGKTVVVPKGAKFIVGDHDCFPNTGCYAAGLDMLMAPMEYNGTVARVSFQLGKPLVEGSELMVCSCKHDNEGQTTEEKDMVYSVVRSSQVLGVVVDPVFTESRKSLHGAYAITAVQTCALSPVLEVQQGEFLCILNTKGSLNFTCGLGNTVRRRLLPNCLTHWSLATAIHNQLPFHQNETKQSCVGWKTEVDISSVV